MTFRSNGQFTMTTKQEILKRCEHSEFKDCRINAYPETISKEGILIQSPNFVFVDLDLGNFDNDINNLDIVNNSTLRKIATNARFASDTFLDWEWLSYLPTCRHSSSGQ